jgi:hypothetical protein
VLFGYPIAATAENWLHECLCEMLETIHTSLDASQTPATWPDIIPLAYRACLRGHTGLRTRLNKYRATAAKLTVVQRQQVATCLTQQNRIAALVSCVTDCESINDLPIAVRVPVADLFDFAFGLLTDFGVRDRHYQAIYNMTSCHVCPFCGCEWFDAPGAPREDLDHYLPKSLYPFGAVNLRNLVPMGMRCNERYKLAQDVLRDDMGARRRAFDPYEDRMIEVCLDDSKLLDGADGQTPDWRIDFVPDSPECKTWDNVFHVRERIKRDVLDSSFMRWLGEFAVWFKRRFVNPSPDAAVVITAIQIYAEDLALMGLNAREFLRAPLFRMLHKHYEADDVRLQAFMRDLVTM